MGTRIKNFEATGIALNGRLYAGDLNQIQDDYADLSNFSQTLDAGTFRIGDTSIQLLKYGTAEARLSSALRTDGITRSLGGLYAGAFTTAQRDAIAVGFRPYGLIILNTQVNRLEFNAGTDAVPSWQGVGAGAGPSEITPGFGLIATGAMLPFAGTVVPTGYLLCDGTLFTLPAQQKLYDAIGVAWGGSIGVNFRVPNMQGMIPVGRDPADPGLQEFRAAVGTGGGEKRNQLAIPEMPSHRHTVNTHNHGRGNHAHTQDAHGHPVAGGQYAVSGNAAEGPWGTLNAYYGLGALDVWRQGPPGVQPAIQASGNIVADEAPATTWKGGTSDPQSDGAGASHQNLQPFKLCNYIIKT